MPYEVEGSTQVTEDTHSFTAVNPTCDPQESDAKVGLYSEAFTINWQRQGLDLVGDFTCTEGYVFSGKKKICYKVSFKL